MFGRLKHMLVKEGIQIVRDPRMRSLILVVPIFQIMVFGYAVNTDVRHVAMAIYDTDKTVESREMIERFTSSGYFDQYAYVSDALQITDLIDRGEAEAALRMDKGFGEALHAGREATLQVIVDGTDSNTAGIILSYVNKIAARYNEETLKGRHLRIKGQALETAGVALQTRAWFNENMESRNYYLPAVIALIVMVTTLILSSMSVVREKEIGTIEQIIVTPITKLEFILGKTIPFAIIGFLDVFLIASVAVFWFDIPLRGSVILLFLATLLFLMNTLGMGLLISTVSKTQQQAMMSAFFFNFPAVLLSGFIFPIANMPRAVQWLTYLNPLRYFMVIIRGIFLKGVGIGILWPQMAALAILGTFLLALASQRFQKTFS